MLISNSTPGRYIGLDHFLAYLQSKGFDVGIDQHVRLRNLFDHLNDDFASQASKSDNFDRSNFQFEHLGRLLCPLFAKNKSEQTKFYTVFDGYLDHVGNWRLQEPGGDTGGEVDPPPKRSNHIVFTVLSLVLTLVIIAGGLYITQVNQGGGNSNSGGNSNGNNANGINTPDVHATAGNGRNAEANVSAAVVGDGNKASSIGIGISSNNNGNSNSNSNNANSTSNRSNSNDEPSLVSSPIWDWKKPGWYYLLALSAPVFVFFLYELFLFVRRRKVLSRQHSKVPPYVWHLQPKTKELNFYKSQDFYNAVRSIRKRKVDEFHRLDVGKTIVSTVLSAGYPTFRYAFASKSPEYLVLINRISIGDHQAKLFSELVRGFERENVFVIRYFYEDPRVCSDELDQNRVRLLELQNKYPNHRLIVLSNGRELIDPITGELDEWTTILRYWSDRALLTPEPPFTWGLREIALSKDQLVLPATINGLAQLVAQIETTVPRSLSSWNTGADSTLDVTDLIDSAEPHLVVGRLREHLGDDVFRWLCACALYPHLDWGLTLYLGSMRCIGSDLVSEQNLLKLVRLPWFRRNVIPDEVRLLLLECLPAKCEKEVRSALVDLLEKNPPSGELKNTYAQDDYEVNLLAQRWLIQRNRKALRELLKKIKNLPISRALRDKTLARFLRAAPTLLNRLLPASWHKRVFTNGTALLGFNALAKSLLMAIILGAILAMLPFIPDSINEGRESNTSNSNGLGNGNGNGNGNVIITSSNNNGSDDGRGDGNDHGSNSDSRSGGDNSVSSPNRNTNQASVPDREINSDRGAYLAPSTPIDDPNIASFTASPTQIEEGGIAKLCLSIKPGLDYIIVGSPDGSLFPKGGGQSKTSDRTCFTVSPRATNTYELIVNPSRALPERREVTIVVLAPRIEETPCPSVRIEMDNRSVEAGVLIKLRAIRLLPTSDIKNPVINFSNAKFSPQGDRYNWVTNGGLVIGSGDRVSLDTSGLRPGSYSVSVSVNDCGTTSSTFQIVSGSSLSEIEDVRLVIDKKFDGKAVDVTVRPMRNGKEVGGLKVFWAEKGRGLATPFPTLSPATAKLRRGIYLFWATSPSDPNQKTPSQLVQIF